MSALWTRKHPNDVLYDVEFTRDGTPHLVTMYAQTRDAARCQVAAHYALSLSEERSLSCRMAIPVLA